MNTGKSEECQCGCRGWCTYYPIQVALYWDMKGGAAGVYQELGPFKLDFGEENKFCAKKAGRRMKVLIVCAEFRADWPAWASQAGIRT
eukprot:12414182-Karenia_brevis.AAC.1